MKKTDPRYVSSVVLTNKARLYNEQSVTLMPFLKKEANFLEINTEQSFEKTI
jgi:hypothetical protein